MYQKLIKTVCFTALHGTELTSNLWWEGNT